MDDKAPILLATLLEEKRRNKTPLFVFVLPADDPASKEGSFLLAWFELACGERGAGAIVGLRREWAELVGFRTERPAIKVLQYCVDKGWLLEEPEKWSKQGVVKTYRPGSNLLKVWNSEEARQLKAEIWAARAGMRAMDRSPERESASNFPPRRKIGGNCVNVAEVDGCLYGHQSH